MEDKQYAAIVNYLEVGVYPEGLAKDRNMCYEELQRISKLKMKNCITVT